MAPAMGHGGDLDEASRRFGVPPEAWLDLSTGINPRPYPLDSLGDLASSLRRLPSTDKLRALVDTARAAYDVPSGVGVTATPGTEILIRALPLLIPGPAALLDTSYASYGMALAARCSPVPDIAGLRDWPERSVIVVNPNNPDGRVVDHPTILSLARTRLSPAIVVIDEAYAEAEPGVSVVSHLRPDDPVLVLKSFGKFFGLAGLRLGFAIGRLDLVEQIGAAIGDWPVSGPALEIGRAALADSAWQADTRHWLGNQAQMLDAVLSRERIRPEGGCRLFRTGRAEDAPGLQRHLALQGIWTRIFDSRPGLLRFGLPPDKSGFERLAQALHAR